jgi:hypothetical protein
LVETLVFEAGEGDTVVGADALGVLADGLPEHEVATTSIVARKQQVALTAHLPNERHSPTG